MKIFTEIDPFTTYHLFCLDPDTIISKGFTTDSDDGIHIDGTKQKLKWIAKKGAVNDWSIYCHSAKLPDIEILKNGFKVRHPDEIQKLLPCTKDVLTRYRY